MNELQKEFEATGYTSWINSDLYPDGKIYTQEYTQWLERRVQALSITNVKGQSEQLKAFLTWLEKEGGSPFIDKDALIDDWLKSL